MNYTKRSQEMYLLLDWNGAGIVTSLRGQFVNMLRTCGHKKIINSMWKL